MPLTKAVCMRCWKDAVESGRAAFYKSSVNPFSGMEPWTAEDEERWNGESKFRSGRFVACPHGEKADVDTDPPERCDWALEHRMAGDGECP